MTVAPFIVAFWLLARHHLAVIRALETSIWRERRFYAVLLVAACSGLAYDAWLVPVWRQASEPTIFAAAALLDAFGVDTWYSGRQLFTTVGDYFIAPACSGLEGVAAMAFAVSVALAFDWRRFQGFRLRRVYALAFLTMLVANVVRIVVIIGLAAATGNPHSVVDRFHSDFGWMLYAAVMGAFLAGLYAMARSQRTTEPDIGDM